MLNTYQLTAATSDKRTTVMVVEDELSMLRMESRILKQAGYFVVEANSLAVARECWSQHHPEMALVDLDLAGENGSELLQEAWAKSLETVIIIVTGYDDINIADKAFEQGAVGYIVKPFTPNELLMQTSGALRRRQLEISSAGHVEELQRKVLDSSVGVSKLRDQLKNATADSIVANEETLRRLSSAVCIRDNETGRHIERVSVTAAALADWRGYVVDPTDAIRLAAATHDIGKIGIPDWVLLKQGRLTEAESMIMQRHCELGYALLSGSESSILKLAASIALNHHERWDGKGYPNRRLGNDIPLEARITSVADVFDALTHDRVYRSALPVETVVEIMMRDREGLFDPQLLDLFLDRLDDVIALTKDLPDPRIGRFTRIVIVDDERVLVEGLTSLINRKNEMRVLGTASSLAEGIHAVDEFRPDILLTKYMLPDGDGAALAEQVVSKFPETKVIVFTEIASPEAAIKCITAGCSGILSKISSLDEVAECIKKVHNGEIVFPADLLLRVVHGLRNSGPRIGYDITPREREVLGYLAKGLSLSDIASTMFVSINTARNHIQKVIEKLGAHSKLEAVVIATREKIIDTE